MRVPVQADAARLSRRARLPVLDTWVVEHRGGGVVGLAHSRCNLIPSHFVVDLQGCQQNVPLGVDLDATDRSAVKNGLWAEASVTDDTRAACVRSRGPTSSSRLTDCSLRKRRAAFKTRFPVPKLNHFSQISSRLDRMALILVSWQLWLPTYTHINHSDLCGKNRGTVCTQ